MVEEQCDIGERTYGKGTRLSALTEVAHDDSVSNATLSSLDDYPDRCIDIDAQSHDPNLDSEGDLEMIPPSAVRHFLRHFH